jgi:hypothetical protein
MPDQDGTVVNVYKYDAAKTWLVYFFTLGGPALLAVFFSVLLHNYRYGPIPLQAIILAYALPMIGLATALMAFWLMRPVGVGDAGIETFMFGRRYGFIDWASVARIERTLVYESFDMKFRHQVWIYSKSSRKWHYTRNSRIYLDDYIKHLDRLLEELNGYILKYDIPTFDVDRRRETRRAPIFTIADMVQGKSLDGVSTPTDGFEVAPKKGIVERLSDQS